MVFQVLQFRYALTLLCQQGLLCQKVHFRWAILFQSCLWFIGFFGKGNYASQSQNSGFADYSLQP